MYLIINEDGGIGFKKALGKVDYDGSDAGLDTIIRITNPNNPLMHIKFGKWEELPELEEWCGYVC
tara:strand:- start:173 stop:367 length:195 start_codon:yes stop_codon:yes gene_type:complete